MKIQPVASPTAIQQAPSNANAARAKAVAAFNQSSQPPQPVVQNQNSISPEELSAIQPNSGQTGSEVDALEPLEAATVDQPVEEKQPTEAEVALSRQFAQIARQEKALRAREQQFKAREDAIKAREAAITEQPKQDMSGYISKDRLKSDPLSVFAEANMSYDDVVQQLINQPTKDPRVEAMFTQMQDEIKALKAANEQSQQSYKDQQTQQYQAAVKQIETDTRALVKSDPAFETIRATNSIKDVVDLIEQTYHKDNILLTVEEAAQQVEDYLVEEAFKLTKIEKIQKRLKSVAPQQSSSQVQQPSQQVKQPQPMKTLTNATSSTRQLSAKERAIMAFKGELKS